MMPPARRLLTRMRCLLVRDQDVERWASTKVIFFGLGMGRSGTSFLSRLLGSAADAHVVHEPVPEDFDAYQRAFRDGREAVRYLRFRKREIYLRARRSDAHAYGEVNSVLRRHAVALKHAFPDAFLFHLVRDGRDVVRSMYSRGTMSATDATTRAIRPPKSDRYEGSWENMKRFERCCWYWQAENAYLRANAGPLVRLEEVLSDYGILRDSLLAPLKLKISEDLWKQAVETPENATRRLALPHWSEWEARRRESFVKICGEEMRCCGYDL